MKRGFSLLIALAISVTCVPARAQFTTIINVPPAISPNSIGSGTQVNVFDGGYLNNSFVANSGSELNVFGGYVGDSFKANGGSVVNIHNGFVDGAFNAASGSVVNMSGGFLGLVSTASSGSTFNLSGGSIDFQFTTISGSQLNISGGEFRLDGLLIGGLNTIGNSAAINIPQGSVLSGTLADGSPFAFSSWNLDSIANGTVTLNAAAVAPVGPPAINVPGDTPPHGIRNGQTLNVGMGGTIDNDFDAGRGSILSVSGGTTAKIEAAGAHVLVSGGEVRGIKAYHDTTVDVSGGFVGLESNATNAVGATVNVTGGEISDMFTADKSSVINVSDGSVGNDFHATQSTVNVSGGLIGSRFTADGSTVSISNGVIGGGFHAVNGTSIVVTGGQIVSENSIDGPFIENSNIAVSGGSIGNGFGTLGTGIVTITGGTIGNGFLLQSNYTANMSGGSIGDSALIAGALNMSGGSIGTYTGFCCSAKSVISGGTIGDQLHIDFLAAVDAVTISGDDFRIDGVPVGGLNSVGDTSQVYIPNGILSGTLADGTPFVFSGEEGDMGQLTLKKSTVAPIGPAMIHVPTDTAPLGVRSGQSLTLTDGGSLPDSFNAGPGSAVTINGGTVGQNFEALGANVAIHGGTVGDFFDAFQGTTVNISGGNVGGFEAHQGSTVNVSGGDLSVLRALGGSVTNISGGTIGSLLPAGTINMSGGAVGGFVTVSGVFNLTSGTVGNYFVTSAGVTSISGGAFGTTLVAQPGGHVTLSGNQFRLDGQLISGLNADGDTVDIDIPTGILSGTLADGTPFLLTQEEYDSGKVTLKRATIAAGPATINVPSDAAPYGVHDGQTLVLETDGTLRDNFNAGRGSTVSITGGTVGQYFKAFSSVVNIDGGAVGDNFSAFAGAVVNVSGGTVGQNFTAHDGSTVNISGGTGFQWMRARSGSAVNISSGIVDYMNVDVGSTVNLSGGEITNGANVYGTMNISGGLIRNLYNPFYAQPGSVINITGGLIGDGFSAAGSDITYAGGTIANLNMPSGALKVLGGEFRINGVPVSGLANDGDSVQMSVPSNGVLSGTLADGTSFAFYAGKAGCCSVANDPIDILPAAITLRRMSLAPIGPVVINVPGDVASLSIRNGQTLQLSNGGVIPDNFNAGYGSKIVASGGTIGKNFKAVSASITLSGATVNGTLNAFVGSVVNVSGGTLSGGFSAFAGSRVNIAGGSLGAPHAVRSDGELDLYGTKFLLNGSPINSLVVDQAFAVTNRNVTLSGILADGTPFSFYLYSKGPGFTEFFEAGARVNITLLVLGDYNRNGVVDAADYTVWRDSLGKTFSNGNGADGNFDGVVDDADYALWQTNFSRRVATPGDYNGNGIVDAADYTLWRDSLGRIVTAGTGADGNGNRVIDQTDYTIWKSNFGHTAGAGGSGSSSLASVPEPATATLAFTALMALLLFRRQVN